MKRLLLLAMVAMLLTSCAINTADHWQGEYATDPAGNLVLVDNKPVLVEEKSISSIAVELGKNVMEFFGSVVGLVPGLQPPGDAPDTPILPHPPEDY